MAKILGSWSGMRKYLEQEMIAESLRGRVRYGCTAYVGMDGCRIFEICIDGKQKAVYNCLINTKKGELSKDEIS
jgi:hypothetical protein